MGTQCENNDANSSIADILTEIPQCEWPKVRDVFKKDWPNAIYTYYAIENFMKWCDEGFAGSFTIFCPEGRYDDGTVIMIAKMNGLFSIHPFTLESDCKRLKEALLKTSLIEWKDGPFFYPTQEEQWPHIKESLDKLGLECVFQIVSNYYWITKENADKFEINCPSDVYIAPLTEDKAEIIDDSWPHKYPGSVGYMATLIKLNGGLGLYKKDDDTLCSWILKNHFLGLGVLHTVEEHRRKGYGKLMVKTMTKAMIEEGIDVHTFFLKENLTSKKMFIDLGFELINGLVFYKIKPFEAG